MVRPSGRNPHGVITAKHHGGGNKRLYRMIDFKRLKDGVEADRQVDRIRPEPAPALSPCIEYTDGEKSYILHPEGLVPSVPRSSAARDRLPKSAMRCRWRTSRPGLTIHNVEMNPGQGGKLCRSAGGSAKLSAKEGEYCVITLPSGEVRRLKSKCRATIGEVGNSDHMNVSIGKAGRNRHKGIRPHNRAKARNPIDHPMGGGEGRANGGRHPVSKTGVPAKGGITRSPRKASEKLILRRRKFGRFQVRPQTVNV